MFFSAYFGTDDDTSQWRRALAGHAAWLGLAVHVESRRAHDGTILELAWLRTEPDGARACVREREGCLIAGSLADPGVEPRGAHELERLVRSGAAEVRAITLAASLPAGNLSVVVPPATPQQAYYTRTSHGYVFSDDLRLFCHLVGRDVDPRGIYGLLQYGAVPPPFTLLRNVRRIPPGHVLRLAARTAEPVVTAFFSSLVAGTPNGDERTPESRVRDMLDRIVRDVPPETVLYFSGGVDSALLAARLTRLGRTDVRLLNYSFGPDDPESALAARIALHLGCPFERVTHDEASTRVVLERLGTDYAFPFADFSTLPTNLLVHASLGRAAASGTVLEGTGADGAFGLGASYARWQGVYAAPTALRQSLGAGYAWLGLWRGQSPLERLGRVARNSGRLPLTQAAVAYHALDGIAYTTPPETHRELVGAIETTIDVMSAGTPPEERLSLLDLVLVCAGRMAPKSFDPLRRRGIRAVYPFLDPEMVALSASLSWDVKCVGGEEKGLLKALLARDVRPAWVYRAKSGFTPPYRALFASAPLQAFLHEVVLSPQNPLLAFCRPTLLRQLIARGARGALGHAACDFLWTVAFASGWLAQLPQRTTRQGAALACAAS